MNMPLDRFPLVSIIINNYNYERFIAQAIESALQQTYDMVEVIVVDDGSVDHSREIIMGYNNNNRIKLVQKENGGQASALNAGFAVSRGEVVIFLDADDLLMPSMVKDVVDVFLSRPQIIRVQYRMAIIDEYSHRTGVEKPEKNIPVPSGDVHRKALAFPFDMPWLPTSGNAFSTKALCQIMPIPENTYGSVGADWYLVHLTCLLGPVFFLDSVLACYRVHHANNYEQSSPSLNLEHIRRTIQYCHLTCDYLQQFAKQLGLEDQPDEILSVSYIANRLVSLRLEPENHPIPTDTRWGLVMMGGRAVFRRFDVSIELKILFLGWFFMMAIAPKRLGTRLAVLFFFPQERRRLNMTLRKYHVKPSVV
jgi:glycosyltransferase involved in cell wall biosynthesis